MTQLAINYGIALYELNIPQEELKVQTETLKREEELLTALKSPVVTQKEKFAVIDRIFTGKFKNFLKKLCENQSMGLVDQILKAYEMQKDKAEGVLRGELLYVTEPTEAQLEEMKQFLCEKYNKKEVKLEKKQVPELVGGFILRAGNYQFDWSYAGRLKALQQKLVKN